MSQGYSKSKSHNFLITLLMGMEKSGVLFATEVSTKRQIRELDQEHHWQGCPVSRSSHGSGKAESRPLFWDRGSLERPVTVLS